MKPLIAVALTLVAPTTGVLFGAEADATQPTTDTVADALQAVSIDDAAGTIDAAAQDVYTALVRSRLDAGRVTVAASDGASRTLIGTVSVGLDPSAVTWDADNLAMSTDPALLVASRRMDDDGVMWTDLAVYAIDDPSAATLIVNSASIPALAPPEVSTSPQSPPSSPRPTESGATNMPPPSEPAMPAVEDVGIASVPVGAEVRVVPDTVTQQEVPVVDVSVPEAASSIPELTPTTITTLTDGSEVVTRSWTTPEGQRVTQIVSQPASPPPAAPSPSPVAAFSPEASMPVPETTDRPSTEDSSTTNKRPLREQPASDSALIAIGLAAFILIALAGSSWLMMRTGGVKRGLSGASAHQWGYEAHSRCRPFRSRNRLHRRRGNCGDS